MTRRSRKSRARNKSAARPAWSPLEEQVLQRYLDQHARNPVPEPKMPPCVDELLLRPATVAQLLGLADQTLANWRVDGRGPPFVKLGSAVRYRLGRLVAWLIERERRSTSDDARSAAARRNTENGGDDATPQ